MKTCYLVVGAIGSGKTAISDLILSDPALQHVEYVASDIYKRKFFNEASAADSRGYRCADELAFFRLAQLCKSGADFAYELSPTNSNKIETLRHLLHKRGYNVTTFFVGTESVDINLARCETREALGFDPVSVEKIKSRYDRALGRAIEMVLLGNRTYFIDNSEQVPRVVARIVGDRIAVFDPTCRWFKMHVQHKLIGRGGD